MSIIQIPYAENWDDRTSGGISIAQDLLSRSLVGRLISFDCSVDRSLFTRLIPLTGFNILSAYVIISGA